MHELVLFIYYINIQGVLKVTEHLAIYFIHSISLNSFRVFLNWNHTTKSILIKILNYHFLSKNVLKDSSHSYKYAKVYAIVIVTLCNINIFGMSWDILFRNNVVVLTITRLFHRKNRFLRYEWGKCLDKETMSSYIILSDVK